MSDGVMGGLYDGGVMGGLYDALNDARKCNTKVITVHRDVDEAVAGYDLATIGPNVVLDRVRSERETAREYAVLLEQLNARALALHVENNVGECTVCCDENYRGELWPCDTVKALKGEL